MPVRIRNGASSSLNSVDDVELFAQPFGRQSVRDLQPRRVIGEREVVVPEVADLLGHRANRVAAVRPVGVHVQVALQLRAQRFAGLGARVSDVAQQLLQVRRRLAGQRFGDDGRGLVAHARDVL